MEQKLMRVAEAAKALSLSTTTTYELIGRGIIPSIRLGKSIRVPVRDLEEQLERLRRDHVAGIAGV